MKEKFSGVVRIPDGRFVSTRPCRHGLPPKEYKNGRWIEYEGNLGDVTLGTELTKDEIKRFCPIEE